MALTKFTGATNTIRLLSDRPNSTDGLTPAGLKLKFDQHAINTESYLNNTLTEQIEAQFATKAEVGTIILGDIIDNTITDAKLSDSTGQIKDVVNTHSNLIRVMSMGGIY